MVTKVLKIDVKDSELDELESKLKGVDTQMNKVEGESQKAAKGIKKVGDNGGAIATLDALTGGLATRIRDAAEATKVFNFSLKGTRTALIATGVGAFVVALGLVVAYWDDIVDYITNANEKLQEQIDMLGRKSEIIQSELDILEAQGNLLTAQGKSNDEIIKQKRTLLQAQIGINGAEIISLEIQREKLKEQAKELTFWERIANIRLAGLGIQSQVTDEEQSEIDDVTLRINKLNQAILEAQAGIANIDNPSAGKSTKDSRGKLSKINPITGADIDSEKDALSKRFEELFEIQDSFRNMELEKANEFADSDIAITARRELAKRKYEKWASEERIKERQAELEAKDQLIQMEAGLLEQFSGFLAIFGEENKGLAIAAIVTEQIASAARVISATGVANAKAVAATPLTGGMPFVAINTASAALSIASGAAAAAKAISQLGGGGSPAQFGVSGGSGTPAFSIVDSSPENQLNQALLRRNGEPVEAFVVDKRVTSKQELRRQRQSASSFG